MNCWIFGREDEVLEDLRRVGVRRVGEDRGRRGHERRALHRVDDLHRALLVDLDEHVVFVAVHHHRALAARDALGRGGGRLQLLHALLGELLEIVPAQRLGDGVDAGQRRAAIAGVRLGELALPLRVEQVLVALRHLVGRDDVGVVAHHVERGAPGGVVAVGVLALRGIVLHVGGHVLGEQVLLLPEHEVRCIRAELITSTLLMPESCSWLVRWNTRSEPERSTSSSIFGIGLCGRPRPRPRPPSRRPRCTRRPCLPSPRRRHRAASFRRPPGPRAPTSQDGEDCLLVHGTHLVSSSFEAINAPALARAAIAELLGEAAAALGREAHRDLRARGHVERGGRGDRAAPGRCRRCSRDGCPGRPGCARRPAAGCCPRHGVAGQQLHVVRLHAEAHGARPGRRTRRGRCRAHGRRLRRGCPHVAGIDHVGGADEARDEARLRAVVHVLGGCRSARCGRRSSPRCGRPWSSPRPGRGSRRWRCCGTRRAGGGSRSASRRAGWHRGWRAARRAAGCRAWVRARGRAPRAAAGRPRARKDSVGMSDRGASRRACRRARVWRSAAGTDSAS